MDALFNYLQDCWQSVLFFFGYFQYLWEHMGYYLEHSIVQLFKWGIVGVFWLSTQAMLAAYEITTEFLDSFQYSEHITAAWNAVPDVPRTILGFFRVPECVNILVSAIGTKFTLKFVPFLRF